MATASWQNVSRVKSGRQGVLGVRQCIVQRQRWRTSAPCYDTLVRHCASQHLMSGGPTPPLAKGGTATVQCRRLVLAAELPSECVLRSVPDSLRLPDELLGECISR